MRRTLGEAKNPDGSQRFYPPGEHPATARLREALAQAEHYQSLQPSPEAESEAGKVIGYYKEQLARFEWGEDRAKRDWEARYCT